ncbi:50S ribosomal protein L31 [Rickettsiales endosymbiont of Paramecium tredecaurelia]|uniref:50S ribosomal protein L31 n=1 Tax=Candidatus Sarmatiella mevalonica TaxID=2770581 RepID=UPI001924EC0E|nr:50S ribosomal protein L31 [Candidatus Sarmatiella mevalonica]MBL3285109.1 50S ribosomal protein L31 [Candidatus Sarmatiella mevalonica]
MRKNIHPQYNDVEVVIGNSGLTVQINSSYTGKKFLMDIDYRSHPAWNPKGEKVVLENQQIKNFNRKFSGFSVAAATKYK